MSKRRINWKLAGNVGLAVLALGTVGAVAPMLIDTDGPAPVSEKVQAYYDQNVKNAATPTPEPAAPALSALPAQASVLIVGDSYSEGYGADTPASGYASLLAQQSGWTATIDAAGGTGYTWGGGEGGRAGREYPARIAKLALDPAVKPALVVLQGSQNDYRADAATLREAVSATIAQVKAAWPDAQVLLLGPVAPQPLGTNIAPTNSAVAAAAKAANVPFIDGVAGRWITEANTAQYGLDDGSHLNQAGHAYLADKTKQAIAAVTK